MNSSFLFRGLLTAAVVVCALPRGMCDNGISRVDPVVHPELFRRVWDCEKGKWMYKCPTAGYTKEIGSDADGATACDPAFITYDRALARLKKVAAGTDKGGALQPLSEASAEAERSLTKALEEAKTPDRAWAVVAETWKSGVSVAFQRQALAQARSMIKPSSDMETMNFMFAALDNPTAEMDRCREWARGSALERKKAADRLALLLQNPNLTDRLK